MVKTLQQLAREAIEAKPPTSFPRWMDTMADAVTDVAVALALDGHYTNSDMVRRHPVVRLWVRHLNTIVGLEVVESVDDTLLDDLKACRLLADGQ
jgi:hypothetical protein